MPAVVSLFHLLTVPVLAHFVEQVGPETVVDGQISTPLLEEDAK